MDPVSGAYNVLNPEDVAMYTDPDKILHETLKNLAAEKGGSEVVYDGTVNPDGTLSPNGRWLTKVGDKWEEIKPERVSAITQSTLVGNPQYVNMMSQLARWKGQDATQLISNDVMARAANMATIYSQSNHWTTMDRKANEFALIHARTKATKQALQELLQPGPTMPGLTQNTSMDRFKIKQPFVSKIPNLKSSGPVYIPDSGQEATRVDPQQSDPISYINSSIEQIKAPMLRTAFIETSRQVMKTPGYAKLTDKEKNILLADTWNKKVSSIPTFNQTAIPLENDFLDHYRDQWISGAAKMATYYEINNDGSLGEKVRGVPQPVAKDPAHNMPTNIQVIDGKRGSVLAASSESGRNVKRYLVVGTPWHDRVEENLSGLEALYAPYQGGRAETNINYPLPDGRYVPAKMTVELEPSTLQRVATLETQDGATIIMTDNGYITRDANGNEQVFNGPEHRGKLSSFQADITKSAAAELYRGVGRGSDFFNSYDTKNRYDEQLILSSGLFGN